MTSLFDKLNLRPQERRLVVIVALILFVVLNLWFVIPYFSRWSIVSAAMKKSRSNLATYQAEISRRFEYEAKLSELQKGGAEMLTTDLQFQTTVQNLARAAGFVPRSLNLLPMAAVQTNLFFKEQTLTLTYDSGDQELVDFLVNIASTNLMIRTYELSVKAPSGTRLQGDVKLVGNYNQGTGPQLPKVAPTEKTSAPGKSAPTQKTTTPAPKPTTPKANPVIQKSPPPKTNRPAPNMPSPTTERRKTSTNTPAKKP
jgi:hypothetical protein